MGTTAEATKQQNYTILDIHHHGEGVVPHTPDSAPSPYGAAERIQVGPHFYVVQVQETNGFQNEVLKAEGFDVDEDKWSPVKQVSVIRTDKHNLEYEFLGTVSGTTDPQRAYEEIVLPHANGTLSAIQLQAMLEEQGISVEEIINGPDPEEDLDEPGGLEPTVPVSNTEGTEDE